MIPIPDSDTDRLLLKCLLFNACSLVKGNAIDTIHTYLSSSNTDICFVTETWLSSVNVSDAELSSDNSFNVYRCDRGTRGGGVLILVKSTISSIAVNVEKDDDIELTVVELIVNYVKIRCICVYFTPTGSSETLVNRMERLCVLLELMCDADYCTYIVGDFNLPLIDWINWKCPGKFTITKENVFLDFCGKLGLVQFVDSPTRTKSNSILDLILCNDDSVVDVSARPGVIESDHSFVHFSIQLPRRCSNDIDSHPMDSTVTFDYQNGNYDDIGLNLSLTNWNVFFSSCSNIDEMYNHFIEYMNFLRHNFVPLRSYANKPSIDQYIERLTDKLQLETDDDKIKRLQSNLAKANRRQRWIKEYQVSQSSNSKCFYNYVTQRMNC